MLIPAQILAARALVGMTRAELAAKVGLSPTGLAKIETGQSDPKASSLEAIQRALEASGVVFIREDIEGAGVRLKRPRKRR